MGARKSGLWSPPSVTHWGPGKVTASQPASSTKNWKMWFSGLTGLFQHSKPLQAHHTLFPPFIWPRWFSLNDNQRQFEEKGKKRDSSRFKLLCSESRCEHFISLIFTLFILKSQARFSLNYVLSHHNICLGPTLTASYILDPWCILRHWFINKTNLASKSLPDITSELARV